MLLSEGLSVRGVLQPVNLCREPSAPFAGAMNALSFYKTSLSITNIQMMIQGKAVPGSLNYVERSMRTILLQSLEIRGCSAEQRDGGGLMAHGGAVVMLHGVIVVNNTAERGGGICALGSVESLTPVLVKDCVITGNSASEGAGMLFEDGTLDAHVRAQGLRSKLAVSGTEFISNVAWAAGGGLKISRLQDDWSIHTHTGQELLGLENIIDASLDPDVEFDSQMSWFGRWTLSPDSRFVYAT
jgi:hypothetical protein